MALDVTVGDPDPVSEDDKHRAVAVTVTVRDSDHPRLLGTFDYVTRYATGDEQELLLRSVKVGPRPELPLGKNLVLTVTKVRDLPLSRWEAAARAHTAQEFGRRGEAFVAWVLDTFGPAGKVDKLFPGLRDSTAPGDVRKYRSLLHLAEVAHEYVAAQLEGAPDPAASIARHRQVNPSTVRSWLHRARNAGLLADRPTSKETP